MQLPIHWDDKHLISFLYIFIANSDFVLTGEEAEAVKTNLTELLKVRFSLSDEEKDRIVAEVREAEAQMSEAEKMDTIEALSKTVKIDRDTYQYIVKEMDEIAHSDHYVSVEEHSLMFFVRLQLKKDYPSHAGSNAL